MKSLHGAYYILISTYFLAHTYSYSFRPVVCAVQRFTLQVDDCRCVGVVCIRVRVSSLRFPFVRLALCTKPIWQISSTCFCECVDWKQMDDKIRTSDCCSCPIRNSGMIRWYCVLNINQFGWSYRERERAPSRANTHTFALILCA